MNNIAEAGGGLRCSTRGRSNTCEDDIPTRSFRDTLTTKLPAILLVILSIVEKSTTLEKQNPLPPLQSVQHFRWN